MIQAARDTAVAVRGGPGCGRSSALLLWGFLTDHGPAIGPACYCASCLSLRHSYTTQLDFSVAPVVVSAFPPGVDYIYQVLLCCGQYIYIGGWVVLFQGVNIMLMAVTTIIRSSSRRVFNIRRASRKFYHIHQRNTTTPLL